MRYIATKTLRIEIPSTRRGFEDGSAGYHVGTVAAGEEIPADLVIAASQQFVNERGEPVVVFDADGKVIGAEDDDVAARHRTRFDALLADGSVVATKED